MKPEKEKNVDMKRVGSKVQVDGASHEGLDRGKAWCGIEQCGTGRTLECPTQCIRKNGMRQD